MEMNDNLIKILVLLSVGVIILGIMIDYAGFYLDTSKNSVSNASYNFAVNNTCYSTNRGPVTDVTAMYDDAAHTNTYGTDRYTECEGRGVKVYTNGTGGFDNMTTGTHYFDYTIYKPTGLGGTITGLMVAVFVLALIMIYLGFI